MSSPKPAPENIAPTFNSCPKTRARHLSKPTGRKPTKVLSIRLTDAERATLEQNAGCQTLSSYARSKLLGEDQTKRRQTLRRVNADHAALSELLGAIGKSKLSQNLNQLSRAANRGTLQVNDEVTTDLTAACQAVQEMRLFLIQALR